MRTGFPPLLVALLTLGLAVACSSRSEAQESGDCTDPFADAERVAFDPDPWATNFCEHSVPYAEIQSGGPGKDGIPPIDRPRFEEVAAADAWLESEEPVIAVEIRDQARAYPLQILVWHEIVNDRLAGEPIAVTFCPLCYSAIVFDRTLPNGRTVSFGTTGNLRMSDLVMWDRATESWWQQYSGEAIAGELTGMKLTKIPASIVGWADFKEEYPEGEVLSRETGYDRDYGRNPYVGYDDVDKMPFMYDGPVGDRLPPMARIVGVELGSAARAYPLDHLKEVQVVNDTLGGSPVAIFWQEGTRSAVDASSIAGGRGIGATSAYRTRVGDRTLTFRPAEEGGFVDEQTGTRWSWAGEAIEGELEGTELEPIVHQDVFWFVWSAFQESRELYEPAL